MVVARREVAVRATAELTDDFWERLRRAPRGEERSGHGLEPERLAGHGQPSSGAR
ncbi:MAG: hypothetical protein ACRDGU_06100 [Actinomycetota bacterium]